jgi:hypothetical protein
MGINGSEAIRRLSVRDAWIRRKVPGKDGKEAIEWLTG